MTAVIQIAHDLGLSVIAEGVETQGQLERLVSLHCEQLQGYFLGRPIPDTEATRLLESAPDFAAQFGLGAAQPGQRSAAG